MKYIINEKFALRSWRDHPRALVKKNSDYVSYLSPELFKILLFCDGTYDFSEEDTNTDIFRALIEHEIIHISEDFDCLNDWQKIHVYDNNRKSVIDLRITGRCNLNCPHCFNAKDNNISLDEWSLDEMNKLIAEAIDCGINAFTFTGGEPFYNSQFMEIVDNVYKNGMYVDVIKTNGTYITQQILDKLKSYDYLPRFNISFDGIGCHDRMRGTNNIEQYTIDVIRLCVKNGFEVMVNAQVNHLTKNSMLATVELMEQIGVDNFRMIRTTETPRWELNQKNDTLTFKEYFDFNIDFLKEFGKKSHKIQVICWQFGIFNSKEKQYSIEACSKKNSSFDDKVKCCSHMIDEMAIGSDGKVYICHQSSGYYDKAHIDLGNVKRDGLRKSINNPRYIEETSISSDKVWGYDKKCQNCRYFRLCRGGCRMLGFLYNGDVRSHNPMMCLYYEGGYERLLKEALPDWKNLSLSINA